MTKTILIEDDGKRLVLTEENPPTAPKTAYFHGLVPEVRDAIALTFIRNGLNIVQNKHKK